MGKQRKQCQTLFWEGSKITAGGDCSHEIKRHLLLGRKVDHIKKQRHYFVNKGQSSQGYGFSSGHVWMSEKTVATHSSTLAWKIPWTEKPGRLQSMGSLRVEHDWATSLSLFTFMHWRRKWKPTPVFLPGESQGRGSLVVGHLWGRTESDMTEVT